MGFIERRMEQETRSILHGNEKLVMTVRQRLYNNLTPSFVLVTNRRIVIINNSFWGLYTGFNLTSPTNYNSIAYNQITSVILIKGNSMCSVAIRLHGYFEKNLSAQSVNEGQIDGLSEHDAVRLTNFIDRMIESHELRNASMLQSMNPAPAREAHLRNESRTGRTFMPPRIDNVELGEALTIIKTNNSKFIWLGAEPAEQLGAMLGVRQEHIVKMPTEEILEMDDHVAKSLESCVLVGYDDRLPTKLAGYLGKTHGITAYTLRGGVTARLNIFR